jgi:ATP-dependent Clp protease ATP-binding subunit ClpB
VQRAVIDEVRRLFRPEFLNRLDETVVFSRLDKSQIRKIVDIQLQRFAARLTRRELSLDVSDAAKDFLAEVGWDPQYGARPLKRAIQKNLEDALAKRVLAGEFPPGTRIQVDRRAADGQLVFVTRMQN